MEDNFILKLQFDHIFEQLKNIVFAYLDPVSIDGRQCLLLMRLQELHWECLENNLSEFSWNYLHKNGKLCKRDYTWFPKELQGKSPEDYLGRSQ